MFIGTYCQKYKNFIIKLHQSGQDLNKRYKVVAELERFLQQLKSSFGDNAGLLIEIFD
jgi:hypothetical protein